MYAPDGVAVPVNGFAVAHVEQGRGENVEPRQDVDGLAQVAGVGGM